MWILYEAEVPENLK
ncbi:MAG: cyclic lactone autoinducer peptide [Firmicutes bacterium]|nr:cyclic lactone autoinducer peptide [Bacillota bacterium]